MLYFVNAVVDKLRIIRRTVRVAVVRYSDTAELTIAMNHIDHVHQLISNLSYVGDERSDLAHALDVTRSLAFDDARSSAWRVVVVITEHLLASPRLSAAVDDVRSSNIELIVVAVSGYGGVEFNTLSKISSETSRVDDYDRLADKTDEVVHYICDGKRETLTSTSTPRGKIASSL